MVDTKTTVEVEVVENELDVTAEGAAVIDGEAEVVAESVEEELDEAALSAQICCASCCVSSEE